MEAWIDLHVKAREQLTPDVVMLELTAPDEQELPTFEAGAYIDIQIPGGMLRPYSLCSAPHDRQRYAIAVRKQTPSRGASAYLHDAARVGDRLRVRHPLNEFPLQPAASHTVLLGGGVGIAPLLSMASALWQRGASFEVHLCARNAQDAPFFTYLQGCAYRSKVHFHWSEEQGGRIDFDQVMGVLSALSHIYLCGPRGYMDAAFRSALSAGCAPERIHFEHFR